jgi:hypothetical protein
MKGTFSLTIEGIETKVEGIPVKLGKLSFSATDERNWFDMFLICRFVKALPKLLSQLCAEAVKMQGLS